MTKSLRESFRKAETGHGPIIRSDHVRRQIADQIISGALRPGQQLDEKKLAEAFNVSRTPVREALRQLAAANLVEWRPHQSAVVAKITPSKMVEMFEVMAELRRLLRSPGRAPHDSGGARHADFTPRAISTVRSSQRQ